MKTYTLRLMLSAFLALGCSNETDNQDEPQTEKGIEVTYSLLLKKDDVLSNILLEADAQELSPGSSANTFESVSLPEQSYRDGNIFGYYNRESDCSHRISSFDFTNHSLMQTVLFDGPEYCEFIVRAMAVADTRSYLAYELPGAVPKETNYFLRILEHDNELDGITEVALDKMPLQLLLSNQRIFMLTFDFQESGKKFLTVLDANTGDLLQDINLGFDALKLLKDHLGDVVVSYPNMHQVMDSSTLLSISTVQYTDGTEPNFGETDAFQLGIDGNLYYARPTGLSGTTYAHIPGIYEFETNTAILYYYENFLTEEERTIAYDIGDTSMVSYDAKNNILLIGYQKEGDAGRGGLLRIKPAPEPRFIDQTDLEAVPLAIFIK